MLSLHGPGRGIRPPKQELAGLCVLSCASNRREPEAEVFGILVFGDEDENLFETAAGKTPERKGETIDALFDNGACAGPDAVEDPPGAFQRSILV